MLLPLLIFSLISYTIQVSIRKPENEFSRGSLDYRTLLLDVNSASLFVGARGRLYRLWAYNVNDTSENLFAEKVLSVSPKEFSECKSLGNDGDECATSVRTIFLRDQRENLLVCSSAALKPEVRVLDATRLEDKQPPSTVIGLCAPDPTMNTTAVYVEWGNSKELPSIYSGIRTGMAGENHLIYRPPLSDNGKEVYPSMRTVYTDNKWLNEPQFVGSFEVGEHVYFFFREIAVEIGDAERQIHSRVARVCKKDVGGKNVLRQVWTSFVKARLNCSISAQYPYYFDHIQSVARVDSNGDTLFYAGMSTSDTAFVTSAVCVFALKNINHVFDHGLFVEATSSSWQTVAANDVPRHRPGTCVSSSLTLSDSDLHFAKSHLLMAEPVSGGVPIIPKRDTVFSLMQIDSLPEYNVIFAINSRSRRVFKVSHWKDGAEWKWHLHEEVTLEGEGNIAQAALLPGEFLFTTSPSVVSQFSLSSCGSLLSCHLCSVDPYCSWNVARGACYPREKVHHQSVGWISSWAGKGARECSVSAKPILKKVYPGDAVYLTAQSDAHWTRDGVPLDMVGNSRIVRSVDGGVMLMDLSKRDNGDYEALDNGRVLVKYRLIVDHEDCAKPKTMESFRAAQREWCKKMDGYKKNMAKWQTWFEKNQQCPIVQNGSSTQLQ